MNNRKTRIINVGGVSIGGTSPVRVQSMTNTDTRDAAATVAQIKRLEALGCELIRVAVPDETAAGTLPDIISRINIPLIADIHFDYRLAVMSLKHGAACVRINPGNIGGKNNTAEVIRAAADFGAAIRIGVNSGSLEKDLLAKGGVSADTLAESALRNIEIPESLSFYNYKVSIKASSVPLTVKSYEIFTAQSDAPLHIGVTEAGTCWSGTIKSAVGIGALLLKSIGDTVRVSLTAQPEEEIRAAWAILAASGARRHGVEIISCPTCGRTQIDIIALAEKVEAALAGVDRNITVAVMGCAVNGPGEAREADYGIAGGKGEGLIFAKGTIIRKVPENELLPALLAVINGQNI